MFSLTVVKSVAKMENFEIGGGDDLLKVAKLLYFSVISVEILNLENCI